MKIYWQILKSYLFDYRIGGVLFWVEFLVLWAVLAFSDMPKDITGYLVFLHLLLFAFAFGISLWRYGRQYLLLAKTLEKSQYLDWQAGRLNLYDNQILEICDQLLVKQNAILQEQSGQEQAKLREYQEYYTLWVHQMKTPIFALELLLRQAEEVPASAQMKAELLKIKDYSQLALQYIRMENMTADLEIRTHELQNIVKKQLKKYALLFINQKIKLELADFELKIVTDEKWLSFVIAQVLTNALKYTSAGGQIRIYVCDKELVIEDNGLGIRAEDIPKLFRKGFTGNNGRLQKEASGMGLYLSAKVMKTLGHGLRLESELGRGTKVFLDFSECQLEDY
ncbi:sensor histidine kinase [Clostridiales bacterium COT073_COT-073]|nr:sensor histidine kinase [Clostridiales bacterium COT073_COT-073]